MKQTFEETPARPSAKGLSLGLALTLAGAFALPSAIAASSMVDLGTASGFAVLAGSGITVAGAVNSTTITGDIGSFATTSITGLGNVVLNGVDHAGDGVTQGAKFDLVAAYNDAAGRAYDVSYADGHVLAGTLNPGVYNGSGSLFLSGALTLDARGDPNAIWIFQASSTLITASGSSIVLANGAQAGNIYWQVGSSATLGTSTDFTGTILSLTSITLDTGATLNGRALARNGAVTMDNNTISVPEPGSTVLVSIGMVTLLTTRRRPTAKAAKV
jgi:hypothetical protein